MWKEIESRPMELVEAVIVLLALIPGIYIITPLYDYGNPVIKTLFSTYLATKLYGLFLFILGVIGTYGVISKKTRVRRGFSFTIFFLFLYFTILRIILEGAGKLTWVSIFANSLIAGIVYIWLRLKVDES